MLPLCCFEVIRLCSWTSYLHKLAVCAGAHFAHELTTPPTTFSHRVSGLFENYWLEEEEAGDEKEPDTLLFDRSSNFVSHGSICIFF